VPLTPGRRLAPNDLSPFRAGPTGRTALGNAEHWREDAADWVLAGLRVSHRPRYVPGEPGGPLARLDGTRPSPADPFALDAATVALLPLIDDPAVVAADRLVRVAEPNGWHSHALALEAEHADPYSTMGGYRLRGLKVSGSAPTRGQAVAMGYTLYVDIRDCQLGTAAVGLGTLGSTANYWVRVRDSWIAGGEAAVFGHYCMMDLENLHVPVTGRTVIRNSEGLIRARGLFVEGQGHPETLVEGMRGAQTVIDRLDVDFEQHPQEYPSVACFRAEPGPGSDPSGVLELREVNLGTVPPGRPVVLLLPPTPGLPPAWCTVLGLQTRSRPSAVVEGGAGWTVKIGQVAAGGAPPEKIPENSR
jgi:hypothetical protein